MNSTTDKKSIKYKTPINYRLPVMLLDAFTKVWCIDHTAEDLEFMCRKGCTFEHKDGRCMVKEFKCKFDPDYSDFGSMTH